MASISQLIYEKCWIIGGLTDQLIISPPIRMDINETYDYGSICAVQVLGTRESSSERQKKGSSA